VYKYLGQVEQCQRILWNKTISVTGDSFGNEKKAYSSYSSSEEIIRAFMLRISTHGIKDDYNSFANLGR
jgi:hypothetical protein